MGRSSQKPPFIVLGIRVACACVLLFRAATGLADDAASVSRFQSDIDTLWRMANENPRAMADGLNQWVGPLLQAERYEDVEGLTLLVILEKPYHVWAVAVAQKARVQALLAQGKFDQALAEAKSYYNQTTLRETGRAADLVAEALRWARDPLLAEEFLRQAQLNHTDQPAENHIFKSIKVNGSIYEP